MGKVIDQFTTLLISNLGKKPKMSKVTKVPKVKKVKLT
jgi:hypothetical protein